VPWSEGIGRLPAYLGSLSLNPLVDESFHDRVFFALAAGVAPLSDVNAFARTRTPGLLPYMFECEPDAIRAAADALLSDPADAIARAEDAASKLSPVFTLRHSVQRIVEFVAMHKLNAPC
jgi:hypothetical protein